MRPSGPSPESLPQHIRDTIRNHAVGSCAIHSLSGLCFQSEGEVRHMLRNFPHYPGFRAAGGYVLASASDYQGDQIHRLLAGGFKELARFYNPVHDQRIITLFGAFLPGGEIVSNVVPSKEVLKDAA